MSIIEQLKELEVKADKFLADLISHDFYPGEDKLLSISAGNNDDLVIYKSVLDDDNLILQYFTANNEQLIDLVIPCKIVKVFSDLESFLLQSNPTLYQNLINTLIEVQQKEQIESDEENNESDEI